MREKERERERKNCEFLLAMCNCHADGQTMLACPLE
jgi:hypothetical protein